MKRSGAMRAGGIVLLIVGVAALALAFASGEVEVALVLIIPIIYGAGALAAIGILMIFLGFALLSFSFFTDQPSSDGDEAEEERPVKKGFGGVVLIGPIPIVFGSARTLKGSRLLLALAILSMIALILYLILIFR